MSQIILPSDDDDDADGKALESKALLENFNAFHYR